MRTILGEVLDIIIQTEMRYALVTCRNTAVHVLQQVQACVGPCVANEWQTLLSTVVYIQLNQRSCTTLNQPHSDSGSWQRAL